MSYGIPDDPIIRAIERTGYPPWIDFEEIDEEQEYEEEGEDE